MYDLARALLDHDLPTLRIIAEWYELDLTGLQKPASVKELVEALSSIDMAEEITYLPPEELAAFQEVIEAGGRIPVGSFERNHGSVRQMGPGRLEREEPWLDPISPAEALWYRGFLYRAFDDNDESDLVEYYYLPQELSGQFTRLDIVGDSDNDEGVFPLESVVEPDHYQPAFSNFLDDFTALMSAAQNTPIVEDKLVEIEHLMVNPDPDRLSLLYALAWEMKLLRVTDEGARPTRQVIRWLQQSRSKQERDLRDAWSSSSWSELCHTPGLECEGGAWEHDPKLARQVIIDSFPRDLSWYRLADLVDRIKERHPDFQRPGGNYDTWYIRDTNNGDYLTGYRNWHLVEGRQLTYIISSPGSWLGLVDTALGEMSDDLLFRLTPSALAWIRGQDIDSEVISVPIVVKEDATVLVPFNANAYHRFQVARIAEAEPPSDGQPFSYRLTPSSLEKAQKQGIQPERVLRFLQEASGRNIPQSTRRAVERWSEKGTEARIEQVIVLRVRDAEILDKLRANTKTNVFIAETLGDLAVVIHEGHYGELRKAAASLGLLLD